MNNRPLILRGNIIVKNQNDYIIGRIIKNKNVEEKNKYIQILENENIELFEEGYLGYIFQDKPKNINLENINYCYQVKDYETLIDFDVVEIINKKNIRVLYRDDSDDNVIMVTNQCNSNCIMCPDPDVIRNTKENPDIRKLIEQVRCIPEDTKHITITGGEPGILKENLIVLLNECKENLQNTEFLLLSNGRVFADEKFTTKLKKKLPNQIRIAIPIYADNEELHDQITRAKGSFRQTITGIRRLIDKKIDVEIRIVVLKKNYQNLEKIAKFIVKKLPEVKIVNIMALEMTGNAHKNKKEIWISSTVPMIFIGWKNS